MLAMRRRPFAKRVADLSAGGRIDTSEFTPWPDHGLLVGGAVRDVLLGRRPHDVDWVVPDPAAAARAQSKAVDGPVFALDEARGHWRVLARSAGGGSVVHDFVPLSGAPDEATAGYGTDHEADLEADLERELRRRDLTINAIAARPSGELIDPTGGVADLAAGRVRMTSLAAMRDDPVRPLRAVRFAGLLGFDLEHATRAAVSAMADDQLAGRAPLPAPERVRDELVAVLLAETAARTLSLAAELGVLATFLPELAATHGVEQGPLHHRDVLGHSLEAVHRLTRGFPDAGLALRLATLLHDVGKPATASVHWTGRPTFHGHDKRGAELSQAALRRLRFGNDVVDHASSLVRYHMLPLPGSEKGARRFVHRHRRVLPDLLRLMIADREAARGRRANEVGRRTYRLAIARVLAVLAEAPPQARLLDGEEVMALLALRPGPRVGEALALVDEAVAVGDVKDRDDAEALLRRYAEAQGWTRDG